MICKVYMLVHYCGAPGACNNNEAKNLPSPVSSHTPPYPELRGLAAVLRGCCSFFSSSPFPVFCIFLFTLPFASSVSARSAPVGSEQSEPAPSLRRAGRGNRRAPEHPHFLLFLYFFFFIFSLHEKVLMELRVGFSFQADSFAVLFLAQGTA